MAAEPAWMLYGASGYSGELIAELAVSRGRRPILAGRNRERIEAMAERLGLPARVFSLEDPAVIAGQLAEVDAVLLAAGPFSVTSGPVADACLQTGTHYLDITGELAVFRALHARDAAAKAAGCTLLPGVGFDVVPTDCLALALAEALPGATHLELAVHAIGQMSQGTLKTATEVMGQGAWVCRDGRLGRVAIGEHAVDAAFDHRTTRAISAPLADVLTAHLTTKIPNVDVYAGLPRRLASQLAPFAWLLPVFRLGPVRALAKSLAELRPRGPDARVRETGAGHLWGRVRRGERTVSGTVRTPEAYRFTADAALVCLSRVLSGGAPPGFCTPAMAFGADLILRCEGCELRVEGAAH